MFLRHRTGRYIPDFRSCLHKAEDNLKTVCGSEPCELTCRDTGQRKVKLK